MRLRRRHRDQRLPSGLAEVELFAFWEADLAGDGTATPSPVPPPVPPPGPPDAAPSPAPLGWALGFLAVVLLVVLLG